MVEGRTVVRVVEVPETGTGAGTGIGAGTGVGAESSSSGLDKYLSEADVVTTTYHHHRHHLRSELELLEWQSKLSH